jgi:hypothetical protein
MSSASITTRETFSDTFNQPLDPTFAHPSLSERDYRLDMSDKPRTFSEWQKQSVAFHNSLDLSKTNNRDEEGSSVYDQMTPIGKISARHDVPERRVRGDPVKVGNPNNSTLKIASKNLPRPIFGYTGFSSGQICMEHVPKLHHDGDEELRLRQDMSLNLGNTLTCGYDFSTFAPTNAASSSQRALMDSITHKQRFVTTETCYRRSESQFVKHGAMVQKFARQNALNAANAAKKLRGGAPPSVKHLKVISTEPWH